MKVVHLVTTLGPGGAKRSLLDFLRAVSSSGLEIHVVYLLDRDRTLEAEFRKVSDQVVMLPGASRAIWIPAFRRYVKRERPDLVHTSLFTSSLVGRFGAVGTGVPVLSSLVSTRWEQVVKETPGLSRTKYAVGRVLDRFTARYLTTHFHAVTQAVKESYVTSLGIAPERITVVPRGRSRARLGVVTAERRRRTRGRLGLSEDQTVLVNTGRQEYSKGQSYLVEAFADLFERRPDCVLLVVGEEGRETPVLREMIARHGLERHVRLLGFRDDAPDIVAASDLFVFPSLYEGFAGAAVEAMGLGIPIVASDIAVHREVLGTAAVFAEPASASELTLRLEWALSNPRFMAERARMGEARFERHFEISRVVPRMVGLYRRILADATEDRER